MTAHTPALGVLGTRRSQLCRPKVHTGGLCPADGNQGRIALCLDRECASSIPAPRASGHPIRNTGRRWRGPTHESEKQKEDTTDPEIPLSSPSAGRRTGGGPEGSEQRKGVCSRGLRAFWSHLGPASSPRSPRWSQPLVGELPGGQPGPANTTLLRKHYCGRGARRARARVGVLAGAGN